MDGEKRRRLIRHLEAACRHYEQHWGLEALAALQDARIMLAGLRQPPSQRDWVVSADYAEPASLQVARER
jgi:hypothetical protein